MSYIKFEHRGLGDDRWLDVSPAAFAVHVWALDYCNEQATDGAIPATRAHRLVCPTPPADIPAALAELVDAGVWERTADGYRCPEFLAHGIAAAEQDATRKKWAEDKRRRRLHAIGNHSLCTARSSCAAIRGETEPVHQWTSGRLDPTRPDQTPKGSGTGSSDGAPPDGAGAPPEDAEDIEKRLGRTTHAHSGDCCPLPPDHPIHTPVSVRASEQASRRTA